MEWTSRIGTMPECGGLSGKQPLHVTFGLAWDERIFGQSKKTRLEAQSLLAQFDDGPAQFERLME